MAVTIYIETDNAEFGEDTGDMANGVARILDGLAEKMRDRGYIDDWKLYDASGNNVGYCVTS